ncbi:protein translocase subunit SecF [Aeromonas cavernicola]|uniref:Protein-export membrane protein SecF n=2 Tax=Aeromonas cavernicola TaxID=1006623 RepID=A0A2H9U7R7_9GAMM|nr:protein translocase subunit SecF [Aeromonas cavernicola]
MIVAMGLTRWRYIGLWASILLTVASVAILLVNGLALGLDFTGGTLLEFQIQTLKEAHELNAMLTAPLAGAVELSSAGVPGEWLIKLPPQQLPWAAADLAAMLGQQLALPVELLRTTMVGPQVGAELFEQGMLAILVASLAMSAYLAFRFEWRQAIGILLSVVHDAIVALGLLSLFQIEFDLNIIAGLMAVIGYSLNDSIVISDRLRDLLSSRTQMGIHACSDVAIKATFSRTMITSGTTLFTVGALLLFGGEALYGFAFTLFVGIVVGTISSITIASTVQELLGLTPEAYRQAINTAPADAA